MRQILHSIRLRNVPIYLTTDSPIGAEPGHDGCLDVERDARKKLLTPGSRRAAVDWAINEKSYTQRKACHLVGLDPKTSRYRSARPDDMGVRKRLRELAAQRRRFGYRRLDQCFQSERLPADGLHTRELSGLVSPFHFGDPIVRWRYKPDMQFAALLGLHVNLVSFHEANQQGGGPHVAPHRFYGCGPEDSFKSLHFLELAIFCDRNFPVQHFTQGARDAGSLTRAALWVSRNSRLEPGCFRRPPVAHSVRPRRFR